MGLTETYTAIAPERKLQLRQTKTMWEDSYAFTTQKESREVKIVNLTMQWDSNPLTINDTAAQNQTLFTTA